MPALAIRTDLTPDELRQRARREDNGRTAARMFAIANALDGMSRERAARLAGMDRQVLRDWVVRYNVEGLPGLRNRQLPGPAPKLTEGQMATLRGIVLKAPDVEKDGVVRWRLVDLVRIVEERFGVTYCVSGMWRLLESLDLSYQKARPVHPRADLKAQAAFKKRVREHPECDSPSASRSVPVGDLVAGRGADRPAGT
jgi:transposase